MSVAPAGSKLTLIPDSEYGSEDFRLDSEVEEKMLESRRNKKIAFLSSCPRTYYPEKPGHSKFAQVYAPYDDPRIPSRKLYTLPDSNIENKPISTKGYGIGGLLGKRFADDNKDPLPGPGDYQKSDYSSKRSGKKQRFPPQVWMTFGLLKAEDSKKARNEDVNNTLTALWDKCSQVRVAFGSGLKQPRFGKDPKWNCVGPGHYTLPDFKSASYSVENGFLRGPINFNPPTKLHCNYGPKDSCVECGRILMSTFDYYRSKYHIHLIPLNNSNNQETQKNEDFLQSESAAPMQLPASSNKTNKPRQVKSRVLLCRQCYCNALRGESRFWRKRKEVEFLFEKTRHCSYIHEHNGLPGYTEKASCYWTRRLAKKEAVLSLHWPDKCPRRIVEKKTRKY